MCDSIVATGRRVAPAGSGSSAASGSSAGPAGSGSGATALYGKNSDRKEGECQPLLQFPEAAHPRGSTVQCTHVAIPQVAETYRVLGHSPWWVWGFEHGVNEHGVAIGNHTVFTKEPVEREPGLIGMDLVRLGLERGREAREAVEVMAGLLETYGQGGPAMAPDGAGYHNSFVVADPQQAWLMETSGRRWAARRLEDGAASNHLCLDARWDIASRDLDTFARAQGWWGREGRIDVAAAYRHPHVPGRLSEGRLRRSRELLAAREQHDAASFMAILRDHGPAGDAAPPLGLTPEDEAYFTLCMHSEPVGTTTASLVAPLPTDRSAPWPVWVGFGTPCTGVFLPVYVDAVIPDALARGGETPDEDSVWWAFEHLRRAASLDFAAFAPVLRQGWNVFEEKVEHERRAVEREARATALAGDADGAASLLSAFMARTVREALETAEALRAHIASSA